MLPDFQQALADLTASACFSQSVRESTAPLRQRYRLSEVELQRLQAIARHPGMRCACTLYRANRLAPLVLHMKSTLYALAETMQERLLTYWEEHPRAYSHAFVECDRFCRWVREQERRGSDLSPAAAEALAHDEEAVRQAILVIGSPPTNPWTPPAPRRGPATVRERRAAHPSTRQP